MSVVIFLQIYIYIQKILISLIIYNEKRQRNINIKKN